MCVCVCGGGGLASGKSEPVTNLWRRGEGVSVETKQLITEVLTSKNYRMKVQFCLSVLLP